MRRKKNGRVVNVVEVAAVDADRRQQASVFGNRRKVVADVTRVKEDAASGIAALDGAIGVVPLVDPANGHGGTFAEIDLAHVGSLSEVAQERKCTVEDRAVTATHDVDFSNEIAVPCGNLELVGLKRRHGGFGLLRTHLLHCGEDDRVGADFEGCATGERE